MADLSPDLSVYSTLAKPSGFGAMDPNSMLGLVARGRQLQTQSAIAGALRANPNDPQAALQSVIANPNAFVGPEDISQFAHAQSAQFELQRGYMREAAGAMASLVTKPRATVGDFNNLAPLLRRYGVPDATIQDIIASAKGPNGILDHEKLASLFNWISGNAGLPMRQIPGIGATANVPAGQALYGGGGVPLPQRPGSALTAPPPATTTGGTAAPPIDDDAMIAADRVRASTPAYGLGSGGVSVEPDETTKTRFAQSVTAYNAQAARSQNYQNDVTPLTKMIDLLKQMGPRATGRGTEEINNVKNFLYTMFGTPEDKSKIDAISNYEQLRKYMVQQVGTMSAGQTDARLNEAIFGNPNVDLTQQSNLSLAKVLLGLRRKDQIAVNEFQRTGLQPQQYLDWRTQWEPRQDTAAYVWDKMDRNEQEQFIKQHRLDANNPQNSTDALKRLRSSKAAAERSNVFVGAQ